MRIFQVDAFTDQPFKGNPAGVCLLDREPDDKWMQNVAAEMNLAETAFLVRQNGDFKLRWFTPTIEVDLCGHATLGSAHVLWQEKVLEGEARFHTRSGLLKANQNGEWIELDFPATPEKPDTLPKEIIEAIGADPVYIGKNKFDYIIEVKSEEELRKLKPNYSAMRVLAARGVIVTSRSSSKKYDFVSRFFAPGAGIDEDPVTGSAHCCLAPFWASRLGKTEFMAYQASPRGGEVKIRLEGDRVKLLGRAVTVLRAELLV